MSDASDNDSREQKWTIYDIAREAGVSTNTVSKVLNGKPGVGGKTRQRIESLIERIGYRPHIGARGLRARQNACIGVTVAAPFDVAPVSQGLLLWLFGAMYRVFGVHGEYICFDLNPFTAHSEVNYARGVFEQLFKACVVVGPLGIKDTRIHQVHRSGVPYVALGRLETLPECNSATVDYEAGAYLSTKYLLQRGHTRIAMLKAFQGYQPGVERRRGYMRALEEAGIALDENLISAVTFGAEKVANTVHHLLQDTSVTALIDCSATEDGASLRAGMVRAGRAPGGNIEVLTWTYDNNVAVLAEETARVWLPVREAAEEGIKLLAERTYGTQTDAIRVLYQPVLQEAGGEPEIAKPRRLFDLRG